MKIYKAFKFRMYPNSIQKHIINKTFGCIRFVYNHYYNKKEDYYKKYDKNLSLKDMKHNLSVNLKDKYKWLRECDSMALAATLDNLDKAYTNYFKRRTDKPKPKYKGSKDSYKISCVRENYKESSYTNIQVDIENNKIKLPKLGNLFIKGYRNLESFPWKIINATISRESNKYFVSVLVEQVIEEKETQVNSAIGIDLGVKDFVICADGKKYKKLDTSKVERRIKGLQKALSRCIKNSNNRYKIKNKITRAFMKIRNMRKYYIHEITKSLVTNNDLISVETLSIKDMIQKGKETHLCKSISNASFSELIRVLKYKCKWNNKQLVEIDKYYASSQICNVCGYKNKEVKDLRIREYRCSKCGCEHDRDINASINILWAGINKYYGMKTR